ncbi:MAG: hypothetical protein CO022_02805 [Flavobacteriales bacterium CG_4_9_14_0_2_um_filter_32_27]|nr:MAG: hypothetical protein CO022_02805 [Flavobacteriales bacterium CG_4_9_14_0_2_um_filter_32_27]
MFLEFSFNHKTCFLASSKVMGSCFESCSKANLLLSLKDNFIVWIFCFHATDYVNFELLTHFSKLTTRNDVSVF